MIVKDKILTRFSKVLYAVDLVLKNKKDGQVKIDGEWYFFPYTNDDEIQSSALEHAMFIKIAHDARPILFSAEQADVFSKIPHYAEAIDFRLPFSDLFLQFSRPIKIGYTPRGEHDIDRCSLLAVAIRQESHTRQEIDEQIIVDSRYGKLSIDLPQDGDTIFVNTISLVYEDMGTESIKWASGGDQVFSFDDETRRNAVLHWKNVIVSCIGYINCENIYLEKQGEVPEAVNRKREAKGKSRLEPYYVCRIKGVQYDGHATGEGSKHGIRYDVRGHFRRLETGKTIWVRPHQRGLTNELYVPKVYKVSKGAKPASNVNQS